MLEIKRRTTVPVQVGHVTIGGKNPIVVQSMTNTDTADIGATTDQIEALWRAGSELVRITVNNEPAARAVREIRKRLDDRGVKAPLIGDFHYNGHILLPKYAEMAAALAKYRINPGNVGPGRKHDENFRKIIEIALAHDKAVRIGVNWGSLDQQLLTELMDQNAKRTEPLSAREVMMQAMLQSALQSAEAAQSYGLEKDHIVISAKVSGVRDLWEVYARLAEQCDYALHLGLTEAGMGTRGIVASATALAPLIARGIGDTIRVSLTPKPNGDRTQEVEVAQTLLQSMGIRVFEPSVTACPGCGRTTSTVFQELAQQVQENLKKRMPEWRKIYPNVETMKVAVMGCVVNGPGESKHADIGISLPGTGEEPKAPVYIDGKLRITLKGPTLAQDFGQLLDDYVKRRFGDTIPPATS